jgi:hypothetical protein
MGRRTASLPPWFCAAFGQILRERSKKEILEFEEEPIVAEVV